MRTFPLQFKITPEAFTEEVPEAVRSVDPVKTDPLKREMVDPEIVDHEAIISVALDPERTIAVLIF